jgi:hypothetical protein
MDPTTPVTTMNAIGSKTKMVPAMTSILEKTLAFFMAASFA